MSQCHWSVHSLPNAAVTSPQVPLHPMWMSLPMLPMYVHHMKAYPMSQSMWTTQHCAITWCRPSSSGHWNAHSPVFFVFDTPSTSGPFQQAEAESIRWGKFFVRLFKHEARLITRRFTFLFPFSFPSPQTFPFQPGAMPPVVAFAVGEC